MVLAKLKPRSLLSIRRADCTKYVYDQAQNRRLMIDSNARTTYTCDAANQLNWLVDGTGRTTFTYDQNGNQTLELVPALSRTTNIWNGENRLSQVRRSSTDRSTYTYKSENNLRVFAEELAAATRFIWDGHAYLQEANASNSMQVTYTNKPITCGDLLSQFRSGSGAFYHADSSGSMTNLTNNAGTGTDSYIYRAFGSIIASSGATTNPFKYVGTAGYYLTDSNYYVRNRWLRSTIGRWLSIDPIGASYHNSGFVNLNGYVQNNPINHSDSLGLYEDPPIRGKEPPLSKQECEDRYNKAAQDCLDAYVECNRKKYGRQRCKEAFSACLDEAINAWQNCAIQTKGLPFVEFLIEASDIRVGDLGEWVIDMCGCKHVHLIARGSDGRYYNFEHGWAIEKRENPVYTSPRKCDEGHLRYGGEGVTDTKCANATMEQILRCLRAHPYKNHKSSWDDNCQTQAEAQARDCCLCSFISVNTEAYKKGCNFMLKACESILLGPPR